MLPRTAGRYCAWLLAFFVSLSASASDSKFQSGRQVTTRAQGHQLTNSSVWSPDSRWIVYDTRAAPEVFDGTRIEMVHVDSGEVRTIYEATDGAFCGVVTHHPRESRVVFILGPEHPDHNWSYGFTRRRGAIANTDGEPDEARPLDAMNYAPPFTPGALRGGSHVHVFSPDGTRVAFTYEDEVLERSEDPAAAPNQRNVGVSGPGGPVTVADSHPRNHDGDYFSVLVTETATSPRPGSNDIRRACEEGWIGAEGYLRPDGSRQRYALAFQGTVTRADGGEHSEVFVVDLPEDLTESGVHPLEGSPLSLPAPPRGVTQRRITSTDVRKYPGIQGVRHWLQASPDGSAIAFLMRDDAGVVQIFLVSPNGGSIRQLTRNAEDIASAFTWSPDGKWLAHVMDGSVCVTDVASGDTRRLTVPVADESAPRPSACVFSPDGQRIAYSRRMPDGNEHLFVVDFIPEAP